MARKSTRRKAITTLGKAAIVSVAAAVVGGGVFTAAVLTSRGPENLTATATSTATTGAKNIVLVHGAWADGSCWSDVIERLQQAGYQVTGVQIPLESLDDDAARVQEVLVAQTGPTILVAHSYGGAVITHLGKGAPNVVGLVYVAAWVPDTGESLKVLIGGQQPPPPGAVAFRPDAQGFIWLDRDGFVKFFAPDVDPVQAAVLAAVQKPIAASAVLSEEQFTDPTWKHFPSWYLVSEQDQMIPPDTERMFAQRMGATVSSVAASHVSMISHPDVVTNLIVQAATSTQ